MRSDPAVRRGNLIEVGKGGEEPVAGCEAFFSRRRGGGGGGDLDVPAGGFEVGTLRGGGGLGSGFWFLVLYLFGVVGREGFCLTYSDEVE